MAMLFKVTDRDIFDDNPYLKALESFRNLSDKEIKYIALSRDYQGPYRRLNRRDRCEKALRVLELWEEDAKGNLTGIADELYNLTKSEYVMAAKEYDELQGWSELEMLAGIDAFLSRSNELLSQAAGAVEDKIKIAKELVGLLKTRKEILKIGEEELEVPEDEAVGSTRVIDFEGNEDEIGESRIDQVNG